jgi:predicted O-linked N-acetylglucosamine transferase (SPINDLY family)
MKAFSIRQIKSAISQQEGVPMMVFDSLVLTLDSATSAAFNALSAQDIIKKVNHQSNAYSFLTRSKNDKRLKIGYLSSDFCDHPVSHVIKQLFFYHRSQCFEIYAYSTGEKDNSEYRQYLEETADHFVDCFQWTDSAIADKIYQDEIDILVDLNGHTFGHRLGVLARQPAPLQLTYMGFAGTTSMPCIDYILVDNTIVTENDATHYAEQCLVMPDSYMITDDKQLIAPKTSRQLHGLPEDAFVLCSFNNAYKLDPSLFECWMKILKTCDNAILWLYVTQEKTKENLQREAMRFKISPSRLIFAERVSNKAEHLARVSLADLFLDAFAVNAHATCVDALWAGVPVITCKGNTFATRVASSLLTAIGLPELITTTPEEYTRCIIELVQHPEKYHAIKQKLAVNRTTKPLFNTARFVQHLEKGYQLIWQRYQQGLPPMQIKIPVQEETESL